MIAFQHIHLQLPTELGRVKKYTQSRAVLRGSGSCQCGTFDQHYSERRLPRAFDRGNTTEFAGQISLSSRKSHRCSAAGLDQQADTSFRWTLKDLSPNYLTLWDENRVDVDKSEFDGNISFGRAEDGRNFAIVISKVEPGSASDKSGLKKGQKLLAISSPMQSGASGEMWPVNERPSLRFVQDAVRMTRISTITLDLTRDPILSSASISEDPKTSLMDSMEESIEREGRATIADKLAEAYKDDEENAYREKAQRDRRIQRRKEYMDRESTRDNSKFFIGLAASFFLPAIGILAYAFSSGLLDRIGNSYRPY